MSDRYVYPPQPVQDPRKKQRPGKKKSNKFWSRAVGVLIAMVMIAAFGIGIWRGIQWLWQHMDAFLTPTPSVDVQLTPTTPPVDKMPPTILGIADLTVYQGDGVAYLKNVKATDNIDPAPKLFVDTGNMDLSKPGKYPITYTAQDSAGNAAQATAWVTVLEKQAGYVDLETIYAAADAKLAQIVNKNATMRQQVKDIYAWARLNLRYGGHCDQSDWRQAAYVMFTDGEGDCFGYFAVTKLMFERLGIPNIDVRKVKNSPEDSNHFWSLVSLDNGESWYHFDATPRVGTGDNFCLVTDEYLDAYSQAHKGSHNRDKSLYRETP